MRKILSLRVTALTFSALTLLILTSCGVQNQWNISGQTSMQNTQTAPSFSFMSQIPWVFVDNQDFLSCTKNNIDMCMQEVSYSLEEGMTISCDMFLSEQNRQSCRFNEVTSQAMSEGNIAACSSLEESSRENCEREVSMSLAMDTGDISICESFEDFDKISCNNRIVLSQALREIDTSICDSILAYEWDEENWEKTMCLEEVQFIIDMEREQARINEENDRILAEEDIVTQDIEEIEILSE